MSNQVFKKLSNTESHTFLVESELIGDRVSITFTDNYIVFQSENYSDYRTDYSITLQAVEGWGYIMYNACVNNRIEKHCIASHCIFNGESKNMDVDVINDLISMLKSISPYLPH